MTFAQCVEEISEAIGHPLKYTRVPLESYIDAVKAQGVPEDMQWQLRELFSVVFDGRNSEVMSGVEEALGRPASDFEACLEKAVRSGIWNPLKQQETA